jgi:hypothetical protein
MTGKVYLYSQISETLGSAMKLSRGNVKNENYDNFFL